MVSERLVEAEACERNAGEEPDDGLCIGDIPFHILKVLFEQRYLDRQPAEMTSIRREDDRSQFSAGLWALVL